MATYGQYIPAPAQDLIPVTPNDSADLATYARALRIGAGGTLRITTAAGNVRNTNVIANEVLQVSVRRVHATGTTATGIEAMT